MAIRNIVGNHDCIMLLANARAREKYQFKQFIKFELSGNRAKLIWGGNYGTYDSGIVT